MSLQSALDDREAEELRAATRALLRRPLLRAADEAEAFRLVRRHAEELRRWFDAECGWSLVVEGDVARLRKRTSAEDDGTRPARDPGSGRRPFSARRYVLTCLALASLERAEQQITLGRLAEEVLVGAQDDDLQRAGITLSLERREDRSDLVAVVRLLLDLGVLARVVGSEDTYVRGVGDVLYDVHRRTLALLTSTPRGASTVDAERFDERIAALAADPRPEAPELRVQHVRRSLTRRLVDDPVVYRDELDEEELQYLVGQRSAIASRLDDRCGLLAEARAEGIAMVDPEDVLTDVRMPESGTDGHATLLLAEHLAGRGDEPVPWAEIEAFVAGSAAEHARYWRASAREPGAEVELATAAIGRLEALGLARRTDAGVVPRPALARFAVDAPTLLGGGT
jgi:uncharacterized protein (TIGR02678 family)